MRFTDLNSAVTEFQGSKDPLAFKSIYDFLSGKLYYLCLRYLKNENDAQDILQETFIVVYHKISTYKGQGNFEGWVKRIAINHCLQKLRLGKKHFVTDELQEKDLSFSTDEWEQFRQDELEHILLNALKEMPVGYRTILNLAVLEEYSHKEIGELLNISESTSRSQLSRAKLALREKLSRI